MNINLRWKFKLLFIHHKGFRSILHPLTRASCSPTPRVSSEAPSYNQKPVGAVKIPSQSNESVPRNPGPSPNRRLHQCRPVRYFLLGLATWFNSGNTHEKMVNFETKTPQISNEGGGSIFISCTMSRGQGLVTSLRRG